MSEVEVSQTGGVVEIALARPAKKNAITDAMYGAMADALAAAQADEAVRVVLFRGEGDDFTAGNDLADFAAIAGGRGPAKLQVTRLLNGLADAAKPVVAAVTGAAVGVGTTLLLHCDLVYVAADAKLSVPFVNLGLVPEAASSLLLPAAIGHRLAFEMVALGRVLSGEEAARLGLVNAALPADEVLAAARQAAAALATRAPGAVTATKRLMRDAVALRSRIAEETTVFAERLRSSEAREAFTAFSEKRAPRF